MSAFNTSGSSAPSPSSGDGGFSSSGSATAPVSGSGASHNGSSSRSRSRSRSHSRGPICAVIGISIGIVRAPILLLSLLMRQARRKHEIRGLPQSCLESVALSAEARLPSTSTASLGSTASIGFSSGAGHIGEHITSSQLGPKGFSYEQLSIATKNFSESEVLGRGGFGLVYKGELAEDGSLVAVKCIAGNSKQGVKEFEAEVSIIGDLRHRNLVRLKGWCYEEGKLLLVYDYMPNGSLDYLLFSDTLCGKLTWERRYSIALGLGSALQYLHEEYDTVIIHRDVKSSNVLLDQSFNSKLGDFGLSRQMNQGMTSHSTVVAGTLGYMSPEIFIGSGKATVGSDVYAFGAVLLELVCGKRAIDASLPEHDGLLVDWVWHLHSQHRLLDAVDKRLGGQVESEEAKRMLVVGLCCSHPDAKARPKIRRAMEALLGTVALPSVPLSKPTPSYGPLPPMSISQVLDEGIATTISDPSSCYPPSSV